LLGIMDEHYEWISSVGRWCLMSTSITLNMNLSCMSYNYRRSPPCQIWRLGGWIMFVTRFLKKHYTHPNMFGVVCGQNFNPQWQSTFLAAFSFIHSSLPHIITKCGWGLVVPIHQTNESTISPTRSYSL